MGVSCLHVSSWYTNLGGPQTGSGVGGALVKHGGSVEDGGVGNKASMLRPVHVRGERAGVLAVVLPVVGVALVVRLLRGALASPDDGQATVARVRAAHPPTPPTHQHTDRQAEWTLT